MNTKDIFSAMQAGEISSEDAEKEIIKIMGTIPKQFTGLELSPKQSTPVWSASREGADSPSRIPEESMTQSVLDLSEIEPGIVQLTMQDKVNKNTFSMELIMGLMQAFKSIQEDSSYKVVILTGYDSYFACGGNKEVLLAIHEGKMKMTDGSIYSLALECEIPVIAAMQGHGIGGGWCLGMFCDFIIMSRESTYTCNHMKYGFTPGDGATLIFPEKLGKNLAQEILFTGNKFRGSELELKGASVTVLPKKEVLPYAIRLAKDLSQVPRESLVLLKAHMTDSIRKQLSSTVEKEWKMQEKTFLNKPKVLENILSVFDQSTVSDKKKETITGEQIPELIHLNRRFQGRPVFWLHGESGGLEGYQVMAQKSQRPFYGIQARGRMTAYPPLYGISAMASFYIRIIQSVQPQGPYDLGGYSVGGVLAYEITRQLQELGQAVHTIVMLDSFDSTGMQRINFSNQTQILQAVNMALINRIRQEPQKMFKRLIHQQEVKLNVTDEELLKQLILFGKTRGLSMTKTETELYTLFQKYLQVQQAFALDQFNVLPLPDAQAVTCYYFRNKSGLFLGELEPYFRLESDKNLLDHTNYWEEWERQLPNLHMMDVDSSNHIMLLFKLKTHEGILAFCEKLYSDR